VCSFQGCNYQELSEVKLPGASAAVPAETFNALFDHADPYIGDYVKKLRDFVEYYNIDYPAHEADDVTILSVRDDLLGPRGQCSRESLNLLHYSDTLNASEADDQGNVIRGWQVEPCSLSGDKCLAVTPDSALKAADGVPDLPPEVGAHSGMTWLHESSKTPYQTPNPANTFGPPPHSVFQTVELQAGGSYVLSWWDMARAADGGPADPQNPPTEPYTVAVFGPNWELLTNPPFVAAPFVSAGGCDAGGEACSTGAQCCSGICLDAATDVCASEWSSRRTLPFQASTAGLHRIVFMASTIGSDDSALGSVAFANIQLQLGATEADVTAYEATGASRLVLTNDCIGGSPENFRALFDYKCENNECFYELTEPILVDTRLVDTGESKLVGKIARGNFNYRHVTVAANVVGTGVTDCTGTPTPSCYGSAYLEYTLNHDAFATPIIDYLGNWKEFNFGTAGISRGKAIAAERFITLPIGSADSAFLGQPQVTKPEFRGRPLSGFYRLRIYDQPSLVWNNLEDVQLVWTYRYWSRIRRESSSK
jgi:hypothetical protein